MNNNVKSFDALTELFLQEYFLFDAVLGELYNHKELFNTLGDFFCLSDRELNHLFDMAESQVVKDVETEDDFNLYLRIRQYNKEIGKKQMFLPEDMLIYIKGEAITTVTKYEMKSHQGSSKNSILKILMHNAESGNIIAMRVLGVLHCEGVFVAKNLDKGLEYLDKAMRWTDILSSLAMFKYSNISKQKISEILKTSIKDTPYEILYELIKKRYGISKEINYNDDVMLIKSAISANRFKKDNYDSMGARVVFSSSLNIESKKKIVFGEQGLIAEACDLPLYLNLKDVAIKKQTFENSKSLRKEEKRKVVRIIKNYLNNSRTVSPICLYSDSEDVVYFYESFLCDIFDKANFVVFEMDKLKEFDIESTKNNVIIRSLNEHKDNVFLFVFIGNIKDETFEFVKNILQISKRRSFKLKHPSITIDLSPILPICICDKQNIQKLQDVVTTILLETMQKNEKISLIQEITRGKTDIDISGEAMDMLCGLSVKNVNKLIDKVILEKIGDSKLTLNCNDVNVYLSNCSGKKIICGFGGAINGD